MKRIIFTLVILCVLSSALFAGEYHYWEIASPGTSFVRYQLTDDPSGKWTVIEKSPETENVYIDIDWEYPIYVAASSDGENWSKTAIAYPPAKEKTSMQFFIMASPYSFESILYVKDFDAIASKYGFGGEVDATIVLGNAMRVGMELGANTYTLSEKAKADRLTEAFLGASGGYQMKLSNVLYFVDIGGGAMLDVVAKYALIYAYVGIKSGVELDLTRNLSLKGQVAGRCSFQTEGFKSTAFNLIVTPSFGVGYTF